jgi:hypothetical protein
MLKCQVLAKILPEHDLDPKGDPMENLRIWHLGVEEMAARQMFLKPSHYDTIVKKVCARVIVPYSLIGHTRCITQRCKSRCICIDECMQAYM